MEFSRKPTRTGFVSVRVTEDQKAVLTALATALGVAGQSEVMRMALDYYLKHSPEGKVALKAMKAAKELPGE